MPGALGAAVSGDAPGGGGGSFQSVGSCGLGVQSPNDDMLGLSIMRVRPGSMVLLPPAAASGGGSAAASGGGSSTAGAPKHVSWTPSAALAAAASARATAAAVPVAEDRAPDGQA
jgi:hypothetical protein